MPARRTIGKARLYIEALDDRSDDNRWMYLVRIVVPKRVHRYPGTPGFKYPAVIHHTRVCSPVGGMRSETTNDHPQQLIALDCREAFDQIARSAIALCSSYSKDDPSLPVEVADAINEATLEALDVNEKYAIRRRR